MDSKYGQDTVETALQATEDLLTRHPDLQGLYACNASTAVGALQGLQSQKRAEVKMVGFDAGSQSVLDMKNGDVQGLVVQNPLLMGYLGVVTAVKYLQGEKPEKRVDTGVVLVTPENMNEPKIKELLYPPLSQYLN